MHRAKPSRKRWTFGSGIFAGFNVRNAWGNGDDIPVTANPDGRIAVIRIPNETRWTLSSTFSF